MSAQTIPATERYHRTQMVRRGDWDEVNVELYDGRQFFVTRSALTPGGKVEFRDRDKLCIAIVDLADVKTATR